MLTIISSLQYVDVIITWNHHESSPASDSRRLPRGFLIASALPLSSHKRRHSSLDHSTCYTWSHSEFWNQPKIFMEKNTRAIPSYWSPATTRHTVPDATQGPIGRLQSIPSQFGPSSYKTVGRERHLRTMLEVIPVACLGRRWACASQW